MAARRWPEKSKWGRRQHDADGPRNLKGNSMPDAPPATVEDMFVQTASGIRTDNGTMTLLGLTPHTIYFSDRPERIVGHITTHRFLQ